MSLASAQARDRALRRLHTVNRVAIGGSVLLTGLLSDVAANAFSGHTHRASAATIPGASSAPAAPTGAPSSAAPATSTGHRHHHALRRPAQAPSPQPTTPPASIAAPPSAPAPQTAAPVPQTVAPIVVPSGPVVSGGS